MPVKSVDSAQGPIFVHCEGEIFHVKDLRAHPKNPNKHTKSQIKRLSKIIAYQGFRTPIKVSNLSGFITAGHGRLAAAIFLGMNEVPVSFQDYVNDEQEYADIVSDNAIAEWSELNLSEIHHELENLGPDLDIELLGLKNFKVEPADKKKKEMTCPECGHVFGEKNA